MGLFTLFAKKKVVILLNSKINSTAEPIFRDFLPWNSGFMYDEE